MRRMHNSSVLIYRENLRKTPQKLGFSGPTSTMVSKFSFMNAGQYITLQQSIGKKGGGKCSKQSPYFRRKLKKTGGKLLSFDFSAPLGKRRSGAGLSKSSQVYRQETGRKERGKHRRRRTKRENEHLHSGSRGKPQDEHCTAFEVEADRKQGVFSVPLLFV